MNKKVLDGISFYDNGKGYFYNAARRLYLHRYVWEKANGIKIPEGHHVHHIDGNKNNNDPSNLQMLTADEHRVLHVESMTEELKQKLRENLERTARPLAIEWHKSAEGRKWHVEQYEKTKDKLHAAFEGVCEQCGEAFENTDRGVNRFCSNRCKSKWRRDNGLDNEQRTCTYCGKTFEVNKYSKTKNCSRSCANRARAKDSPNLHE